MRTAAGATKVCLLVLSPIVGHPLSIGTLADARDSAPKPIQAPTIAQVDPAGYVAAIYDFDEVDPDACTLVPVRALL